MKNLLKKINLRLGNVMPVVKQNLFVVIVVRLVAMNVHPISFIPSAISPATTYWFAVTSTVFIKILLLSCV